MIVEGSWRKIPYSHENSKVDKHQPANIKQKHCSCVTNKKDIAKRNKAQTWYKNLPFWQTHPSYPSSVCGWLKVSSKGSFY